MHLINTEKDLSDALFEEEKQIANDCYLLKTGVRSCACITIAVSTKSQLHGCAKRLLFEMSQSALRFDGYSSAFFKIDEETYSFWIYKFAHQLPLIKLVAEHESTFLTEWISGKLLGYSDETMETFLSKEIMSELEVDNLELPE